MTIDAIGTLLVSLLTGISLVTFVLIPLNYGLARYTRWLWARNLRLALEIYHDAFERFLAQEADDGEVDEAYRAVMETKRRGERWGYDR